MTGMCLDDHRAACRPSRCSVTPCNRECEWKIAGAENGYRTNWKQHPPDVGTRRGLCRLERGRFRPVGTGDAVSRAPVRALAEGRDGSLWVGTYGEGVWRLRKGKVSHFGREQGLSHESVQVIREDARGIVWVGTDGGGLNRLAGERFVSVAPSLPVNVLALHEAGSTMWVGTDAGLCRVDGSTASCFGPREGLFDHVVYQILDDGLGGLWLSCNKGIFRLAQHDLDELAAGKRSTLVPPYGIRAELSILRGSIYMSFSAGVFLCPLSTSPHSNPPSAILPIPRRDGRCCRWGRQRISTLPARKPA